MYEVLVFFEELVLEQLYALFVAKSLLRLLLQHLSQEVFDSVAQRFLLIVDGFVLHLGDGLWCDAFVRVRTSQEFVKEQSKAVNVNSFVVSFLLDYLRRQVLITSTQFLHLLSRLNPRCKPKIADLHLSIFIQQYILWLQIPVNQSFLMQTDNSKGNLYPNQIFFSQSHPSVLICLFIALDGAVEIAIHAKFLNKVRVSLILHPIKQFYLILGRILQDLILILNHQQIALVPAFCLIDALHAEQLLVVLSFDEEYLCVGALSDLSEDVEVVGRDEFGLTVDLEFWIGGDYFKIDGELDHPLDFRWFLSRHLIFIEIQFIVLCKQNVYIKISGVGRDDVVVQRLRGNFAIFDEMLQDFLPADNCKLCGVDYMIILWDFLVSVVVWVDEREEHDFFF